MIRRHLTAALIAFGVSTPASAATCGGDFNTFIAAMSREAAAAGVSREVIASALAGATPVRRCAALAKH